MEMSNKDILEAFLGQVREHDLEKLASAVELDRAGGGTELPHETLMEVLRPALRESANYSRVPTPERMFFVACEDLINALPGRRKQTGRIGRGSLRPIWTWLKTEVLVDDLAKIENDAAKLIAEGRMDEARALVRQLQLAAGKIIQKELTSIVKSDTEFKALCERIGGASIVEDLRDTAMCLEIADSIDDIQVHFERPLLGFVEEDSKVFRDIYQKVQAGMPKHSMYALLVLIGRMARPWEILSFMAKLEQDFSDFSISPEDQTTVNELLLGDIDVTGLALVGLRPEDVDTAQLLEDLNLFVQLTGGVICSAGMKRNEGWGKRFKTTRDAIAQQMGIFVEAIPGMILKSLPVKKTGGYGLRVPRVPDTSIAPSAEAVNKSVDLAKLFAELRFYADQTGFAAAYSRAVGEFDHSYELFKSDILDHIRTTTGDERRNAEAFAEVLAQIGEEYRGTVEADMIRRRSITAAEEGDAAPGLASKQV